MIIIVIVTVSSLINLSLVTIRYQRTGDLIWVFQPINNEFSLQWMHSVELEQWRETFKVTDNGNIKLIESRFKAWGAGVPENEGEVFYIDKDWFVMKEFDNRSVEQLTISVSCYANHRIIYDSNVYTMCNWVKDNTTVVLKRENLSIFTYFYYLFSKEVSSWRR